MTTISELLDEAKKAMGDVSESALARELGTAHTNLWHWRKGTGQPDTYAVWRLSEILDMDPRELMAIIEGERAKTDERRSYWEAAQKRFRETTKMVFLALALSLFFALPEKAQAADFNSLALSNTTNQSMFIMSSKIKRKLKALKLQLTAILGYAPSPT